MIGVGICVPTDSEGGCVVLEGGTVHKIKCHTAFPYFLKMQVLMHAVQLNVNAFLEGFAIFRALTVQQGQPNMAIA